MPRFDIEDWCRVLDARLKHVTKGINAQITALNAEKAAGGNTNPILTSVDDAAIYFQVLDQKVLNYEPFLWYWVADADTEGIGPRSRQLYSITLEFVFTDRGETGDMGYKLLRYQRALRDFAESNWDYLANRVQLNLGSTVPVTYENAQTGKVHKAIGVILQVGLGG